MRKLALLLVPLVLAAACTTLPESGSVRTFKAPVRTTQNDAPYFVPDPPVKGATQTQIVQGFLDAMVANPINIPTARSFLTTQSASGWRPSATLVYETSSVEQTDRDVVVRFSDAHRLDARGSWENGQTRTQSVHLNVVREDGEWRIDNPPSALIVKSSFFESQFVPFDVFFYDHTGRVLVPDLVYTPRGEATATKLVSSLLAGPDPRLAPVVRSAFPDSAELDGSVKVTDRGVALVPLTSAVLRMSPAELNRAMIQLTSTLRHVSGINRVRMTVHDGVPVPLADGRTDMSVNEGTEYSPTGLGASRELLAIRDGRVVTVSGGKAEPIAGVFGRRGYALRSLALNRTGATVAGVSVNGRKVFVSDKADVTAPVQVPFSAGTDLLRPTFDLFGTLWLVDRTARGAVVRVVEHGVVRTVDFPGVSGRTVGSFAVSPDGTRFAVTYPSGSTPRVAVADILRGAGGRVVRGLAPDPVPVTNVDPEHDLGRAVDIGWRSPTALAVLTRPGPDLSRVVYAPADGSPGNGEPVAPDAFTGAARSVLVNADSQLPLMLIDAGGRLTGLDAAGKWTGTALNRLTGAAYAN